MFNLHLHSRSHHPDEKFLTQTLLNSRWSLGKTNLHLKKVSLAVMM